MIMGKFWKRFRKEAVKGDATTQALLSDLNTTYVPLRFPHKGNPANLSDEQVVENEQYMRHCLEDRLRGIKTLLARQGIHWPESLTGIDHQPLVHETREWAKVQWPVLRALIESTEVEEKWLSGEREAEFIGLSVVSDIGLLIGQLIVENRPTLQWGIDKDPVNKADGMDTYNRWVLLGKWIPDPKHTTEVDVEGVVLTLFLKPNYSNEELFNTWQRFVDACLRGGHEGIALKR